MTVLCIARTCAGHGRHTPTCDDRECRGCLPRRAADGLLLCPVHRDRLAEDAQQAAILHDELALVLTAANSFGEKVAGTKAAQNLRLNLPAVEARDSIRGTLAAWCRMVADERGVRIPTDTAPAMGAFLARHATWLAAHPAADDAVDELHELAHGHPRHVAYPGGARRFPIQTPSGHYATCPEPVTDEQTGASTACAGFLWTVLRTGDSLLPSEIACDASDEHRWPTSRWLKLGAQLMRPAA